MALDWDILNEDCADIGDWFNADNAPCVSSQVTFDSKSTFKFYMPQSASSGNIQLARGFVFPSTFTFECSWYASDGASNKLFQTYLIVDGASPRDLYRVMWYTGIYNSQVVVQLTNTPTYLYIRLGAPAELEDSWHTLRVVVKASRKLDIWLDNRPVLGNQTISATNTAAAGINFICYNDNVGLQQMYLDYVRVDTTPEAPTTVSPLKINTEEIAVVPYNINSANWKPASNLRFYGHPLTGWSNKVCEIPIVATTDTNASKVRIYSGGTVKSLMKLPS